MREVAQNTEQEREARGETTRRWLMYRQAASYCKNDEAYVLDLTTDVLAAVDWHAGAGYGGPEFLFSKTDAFRRYIDSHVRRPSSGISPSRARIGARTREPVLSAGSSRRYGHLLAPHEGARHVNLASTDAPERRAPRGSRRRAVNGNRGGLRERSERVSSRESSRGEAKLPSRRRPASAGRN